MRNLKYPLNVEYVIEKYGKYLEMAFKVQQGLIDKRKGSNTSAYAERKSAEREIRKNFVEKMEMEALELGLNKLFAKIIAQNYITKNMCLGNEIERTLSDFKRDLGLGFFCFDALSLKDDIYRSNYKKYIMISLMREIGDEKRRNLREEEVIDFIENNDSSGNDEKEIEYENRLIQLGGVEIGEDQEVIEDVIDLIIDGALPIKIEEWEKKLEEMREGNSKLTEKVASSREASMIKALEIIYSMEEAQLVLRRSEKQKLDCYADRNRNRNKNSSLADSRIFVPEYDTSVELNDKIYRILNEQKNEKIGSLNVSIQQISHIIDRYVQLLLDYDSYFIKGLIGNTQNSKKILDSFTYDEHNMGKNEFYDLLKFISCYSKEEYESIKQLVLNQMKKIKTYEISILKNVCTKSRNFDIAKKEIGSIVDEQTQPNKYKRMKRYLMLYYSYGKNDAIFEKAESDISISKAIAYEFAIRFLSTKSPEQLLDIVKRFEEYEKSFENTTRKSGGIEI